MFPFCPSLDHVGVLASTVRDLAVSFDGLHGYDPADPVSAKRPRENLAPLERGIDGLRLAIAGGHFANGGTAPALDGVAQVAAATGVTRTVTFPEASRARSAAYVITASEGAQLHLNNLRARAEEFDPMTRDRFLAGALLPASAYVAAQRFRRWFRDQVREVFATVDVVLAPATPFPAPLIGQREAVVNGTTVATQPYLGVYTQPLSFIGLPVVSVPVGTTDGLPMGVQLVGRPFAEAALLRVAAELEARGIAKVPEAACRWS
jgi:Asp-tRNA(Asn)/Glu-tRNA(Gln) amidotransferase A subunit family amidase